MRAASAESSTERSIIIPQIDLIDLDRGPQHHVIVKTGRTATKTASTSRTRNGIDELPPIAEMSGMILTMIQILMRPYRPSSTVLHISTILIALHHHREYVDHILCQMLQLRTSTRGLRRPMLLLLGTR